jgi:hypothetical protein
MAGQQHFRKQKKKRERMTMIKTKTSAGKPELDTQNPPLYDLDLYRSFGLLTERRQLTQKDLRNAIALIEHLCRCHRAALEVPGISSALTKHPYIFDGELHHAGIHCDHAYEFIQILLRAAQRWCAEQLEESPPTESPKAISAPSATPRLQKQRVKREARRLRQ